ncbi:hypothetical protein [Adhaeribacter aquaticus]|uniref:hypothetical protein n=1 Tax=Adhaeribacter aquaticus TaxID=299567 RepID=UPI0004035594|nr:hypothetical protein [Adhaeribacter aquaticus]
MKNNMQLNYSVNSEKKEFLQVSKALGNSELKLETEIAIKNKREQEQKAKVLYYLNMCGD